MSENTNGDQAGKPPSFDRTGTGLYSPMSVPCFQSAMLTGTGLASACALGYYAFTRKFHGPLAVGVFTLGSVMKWFTCQSQLEAKRNDMEQLSVMQTFYEQKMKEAYVQQMRKKAEEERNAKNNAAS